MIRLLQASSTSILMSYEMSPRSAAPIIDDLDAIVSNVAANVQLSPGESIQIYRANYWQGIFALNCSEKGLAWPNDLNETSTAAICMGHDCNALADPLNRTVSISKSVSVAVSVGFEAVGCSNSSSQSKTVTMSYFPSFAFFPINESLFGTPSTLDTSSVFDLKVDGIAFGSKLPAPFEYVSNRLGGSGGTPSCVYYNATSPTWSSLGCQVVSFNSASVTCRCDHLTSFALLLSTQSSESSSSNPISQANARALDFVTYIGLAISIFSLIISLFTFIKFKVCFAFAKIQGKLYHCVSFAETPKSSQEDSFEHVLHAINLSSAVHCGNHTN